MDRRYEIIIVLLFLLLAVDEFVPVLTDHLLDFVYNDNPTDDLQPQGPHLDQP